jgi:hypothetical protein
VVRRFAQSRFGLIRARSGSGGAGQLR